MVGLRRRRMMMAGMNPTSTSSRIWESYCGMRAFRWFDDMHNGKTSGGMLKKAFQEGRRERRGEAYASVR